MNVQTCFSLSQNAVGGKRGFKGDAPELLLLSLPLQLIVEIKNQRTRIFILSRVFLRPDLHPAGLIAVDNSRIVLSVFPGPRAVIQMLVSVKHIFGMELVQDLVKAFKAPMREILSVPQPSGRGMGQKYVDPVVFLNLALLQLQPNH